MIKLLFIDNGIEFDSKLFREKPLGGAEVAFVALVEELAKLNYEVVVYNNCKNQGRIKNVNWKKLDEKINDEKFDVLIVNRGDKFLNFRKDCKRRFFWIHNPANYLIKYRYLSKLFFNDFKIVFSSHYHVKTYPWWAPSKERVVIPYGVDNLLFKNIKRKVAPKPSAIFTSNPMRGLNWLLDRWESEIFPKTNNATLLLFTGSETYGKFGEKHSKEISAILKRAKSLNHKGVILNPPVERKKLFKKIAESRIFLYRGSNEETFCMSAAESQVIGTPAVVCNFGCLKERVKNRKTGFVCKNEKEFSYNTINILNDNNIWMRMHKNLIKDNNHFTWSEVAKKWKRIIDLKF